MVVPNDLKDFSVTWEINYYDHEPEKVFFDVMGEEAENLDALLDELGENSMDREPENSTPIGLGDFNIEWIKIEDDNGKEVWRDEDYDFKNKDWLKYEKENY